MNLKSQLKLYLELKGLTAAELARKSGVSKQVLSLWLGGAKPKNLDQLKSVANALGTTTDHLAWGTGDDQKEKTTLLESLLGDEWLAGKFEIRIRKIKG
jgi:transcriptional regulator with XRE-family HTH domain